jgi:hypothetical protein
VAGAGPAALRAAGGRRAGALDRRIAQAAGLSGPEGAVRDTGGLTGWAAQQWHRRLALVRR